MARTTDIALYQSPLELGTVPAEVRAECEKSRMEGSPWTRIRPLQKGVDASDTLSCDGSQGSHHLDCTEPVVAVQYTSMQGESQHYCEKHALDQNEWDIAHYYSKAKPVPAMTKEQEDFVVKLLTKKKVMREKEIEEEADLMK
jgi:hypothetical protein